MQISDELYEALTDPEKEDVPFKCPACAPNSNVALQDSIRENAFAKLYAGIQSVFQRLKSLQAGWAFRDPVDLETYPDYYNFVPPDEEIRLQTLEQWIAQRPRRYSDVRGFVADFRKVRSWCCFSILVK